MGFERAQTVRSVEINPVHHSVDLAEAHVGTVATGTAGGHRAVPAAAKAAERAD